MLNLHQERRLDDGDLRQGRPQRLAHDHPPLFRETPHERSRQALADYLAVRRALGHRLVRAEKLTQFLAFVKDRGEQRLTVESAPCLGNGTGRRRHKLDVESALQRSPVRCPSAPDRPCYAGATGGYPARSIVPRNAVSLLGGRNLHLDDGDRDITRVAQKGDLSDIDRLAGGNPHVARRGDRPIMPRPLAAITAPKPVWRRWLA